MYNFAAELWRRGYNRLIIPFIKSYTTMARNSQKAQQLKQELLSAVQQHDLITQPVTFAYLNGELSVIDRKSTRLNSSHTS